MASYEGLSFPSLWKAEDTSFVWWSQQASAWLTTNVLNLDQNPMCAILDLGCAKPMGSRTKLMAFKRAARWYGSICWGEPTWGEFTFADSRTSIAYWKMVVQLPAGYDGV